MALGQKTLDKVVVYATKHFPMKDMGFSPALRLRVMIAEQLFQSYASGRIPMTRPPRKVIPEIAKRVYRNILSNAAVNPELDEIRRDCGIREGVMRTYIEMMNDLEVYEAFRHVWGISTANHAKAAVEEGAYSLMEMGQRNSDPRALAAGIDRLSKLHNDFQGDADDLANTATTEIDLIADVKLVRADAENISRSGIEEFKKKYGAYIDKNGGIETLIETSEGVYESMPGDADADDGADYFERIEEEAGA